MWKSHKGTGTSFYNPKAIENRANLTEFINQWNEYVNKQNKTSFWLNLIAGISYLITAIMSFIAILLPGPYNIKDTKNYIYSHWAKAKTYTKSLRKTEDETKENEKHAHQVTKEPDE